MTNDLLAALWKSEDTLGLEGTIAVEEALHLVKGLKSGYGVTVGYNTPDTLAYQMMEYNLFEFSATKAEARVAASTELLLNDDKNGIRPYPEFEKLASAKLKDFNANWLQTEYNLSVRVGQTSSDYHKALETKDDFPWVKYQTIGDSSVREAHAKLDGRYFNLSDKEAMQLWPPNGYGCRCRMLRSNRSNPPESQKTTGKLAQEMLNADDAKWSKSQFKINRGDLKQVFTKSQFYSDSKGLPKKLNKMTFDKYDLKPWQSFKSDLNKIEIDNTITPNNVKELFKTVGDETFMRFKDYFGRKMILSKDTFDTKTKDKYLNIQENRHQLFPHLKEVLNNPDEVWYNKPDKLEDVEIFQSRYIKFYQNLMLVVDCKTTGQGLQILTWYQGKKEDLNLRKGLLIRNKVF